MMLQVRELIIVTGIFVTFPLTTVADRGNTFNDLASKYCVVEPSLAYAVSLKESAKGQGEFVAAHPYAFNTPDGSYYAKNYQDARRYLGEALQKHSLRTIDVGVMQPNLYWQRKKYKDPFDLLDVEENIRVGCEALNDAVSSTDDIVLGIGRYHQWKDEDIARSYGLDVIRIWNRLKDFLI